MTKHSIQSTPVLWARFRFSVVGSLLSSPPARGELKAAIESLAAKTWTHPVTGRDVRFAAKTIERWFHRARREQDDPVGVLRRAVRKDCGKVSIKPALIECLANQHHDYPHWTYQLHYDNLKARVKADEQLGPLQSYSTVRRYMVAQGMVRKRRLKPKARPGELLAAQRRERREIRSYEAEYVGSLWHLDFHHGSLKVVTPRAQWERPLALGILDDHSRFGCHLQWYLSETAEDLVHGTSQAIQKCGLPRALMSDNGSAMLADEFTEGLLRLGILHEKTLPYSPYAECPVMQSCAAEPKSSKAPRHATLCIINERSKKRLVCRARGTALVEAMAERQSRSPQVSRSDRLSGTSELSSCPRGRARETLFAHLRWPEESSLRKCGRTCGLMDFPPSEGHVDVAALTCLPSMYSKPARDIGPRRAFTKSSDAGTSPRRLTQARRSWATGFHSGRQRSLRPLPTM